ncbi:hypothetical protein B0H14DRAFT_3509055 [Mycena olivaceomarginata]|nr:hypothetical protein B0H14DRAFT_3509055 [Mycena olivaceomarginata]
MQVPASHPSHALLTHLLIALFHTRTHPLVAIIGRASCPHVTWIVTRPHLCPLASPHSPLRCCVVVSMQLHPPVAIVHTQTHPRVAIVRTGACLPIVFVDALPHPLVVFVGQPSPRASLTSGPSRPDLSLKRL